MSKRERRLALRYAILLIVVAVAGIYTFYEVLYLTYAIYIRDYKEVVQASIFLAVSTTISFVAASRLEKKSR